MVLDKCALIKYERKSGQLRRETELHEMLLRLYRSPAVLLQITGERLKEAHHHKHHHHHHRHRNQGQPLAA